MKTFLKVCGTHEIAVDPADKIYGFKKRGKVYCHVDRNPSWHSIEDLSVGDYIGFDKPAWEEPLPKEVDVLDFIDKSNYEYDDKFVWRKMGFSPRLPKDVLSISDIMERYHVTKHHAENVRRHMIGQVNPKYSNPEIYMSIIERIKADGFEVTEAPKKVNRIIQVDDDLLTLIGWYIAEGSGNGGVGIEIDLHIDEEHIARKLASIIEKKFGIEDVTIEVGSVTCKDKENASRCYASSYLLSELFENWCGKGAHNKKIPSFLIKSAKFLSPLIRGLFEGDGHSRETSRGYSLSSVSSTLSFQVFDVLRANGIFAYVRKGINANKSIMFTTAVSGTYCFRFFDWIKQEYDVSRFPKRIGTRIIEHDNLFFVPINSKSDKLRWNFLSSGAIISNSSF